MIEDARRYVLAHNPNSFCSQFLIKLVHAHTRRFFVNRERVHPPSWPKRVIKAACSDEKTDFAKSLAKKGCSLLPLFDQAGEFAKLGPRDSTLQFSHSIVHSEEKMCPASPPVPALVDKQGGAFDQVLTIH